MRLGISKSKNTINYYIIKDYTKNGKRSTKNEMQELQQELDKISKEIEDSNYKKLDLDFIESLLEKCADIRELDSNEQRLLIGVLVDKILWDGNTQDVTVYFIGSGDVKKK